MRRRVRRTHPHSRRHSRRRGAAVISMAVALLLAMAGAVLAAPARTSAVTITRAQVSLAGAGASTAGSSYATDAAVVARPGFNYDYADLAQCRGNAASGRGAGWVKNHYSMCQVLRATVRNLRCVIVDGVPECTEIGRATFRLTLVGYGRRGARYTTFTLATDQWRPTGTIAAVGLTIGMSCGGGCRPAPGNGRSQPVAAWMIPATGTAQLRFDSPTAGITTRDLVAGHAFNVTIRTGGAVPSTATGPQNGFRCDSATYVGPVGACIFDRVNAFFVYHLHGQGVDQVAQHISDAQTRPGTTFPPVAGKIIPGAYGSGRPLTRNYYDTQMQDRGRRIIQAVCRQFSPVHAGQQCDEYPFASTYQGAGSGTTNFSARAVDGRQNGRAGGLLSAWYTRDHILDRDRFYIMIRP
jgi:Deoxyribonuclease NucA/NucB